MFVVCKSLKCRVLNKRYLDAICAAGDDPVQLETVRIAINETGRVLKPNSGWMFCYDSSFSKRKKDSFVENVSAGLSNSVCFRICSGILLLLLQSHNSLEFTFWRKVD